MLTLIIVVANQIAVQCIGFNCQTVSAAMVGELVTIGILELIFEAYGMIKIYKRKDEHDDEDTDRGRDL